jgi:hypothetical protein
MGEALNARQNSFDQLLFTAIGWDAAKLARISEFVHFHEDDSPL